MKHRWKSQADHGALRSTRSLWDRDRPNWLSISLGKPCSVQDSFAHLSQHVCRRGKEAVQGAARTKAGPKATPRCTTPDKLPFPRRGAGQGRRQLSSLAPQAAETSFTCVAASPPHSHE